MRIHSSAGLLLAGLLLAGHPVSARPQMGDVDAFAKEIRRLEAEFGGHLGFMAKNLETGETVSHNADERFPTASVIKLPVMAAFYDLVGQGRVDPDAPVVLRAEDKKPGSGILQSLSDSSRISLRDAIRLMITLSDNTATNLVLDRLAATHEERMAVVNDFLARQGLKNTRILNRLYTWETKLQTEESIRYGIGVATPADMVTLLEALHRRTLADSGSCEEMLSILEGQFYSSMIPRFLPSETCERFSVAHKTGGIQETKVDVGLVLSDRVNIALAVFVDKHPDHRGGIDNRATLLVAHVARAIWNYFTGDRHYRTRKVVEDHVDWNFFPGGRWGIYRSGVAPFPHEKRTEGYTGGDGTDYPFFPHYADSSIVVFVPDSFKETEEGSNLIVHFHGHNRDNLSELVRHEMPQTMIQMNINALLVFPQGPYRARDSFCGRVEEEGGFERLVKDVLQTMREEEVVKTVKANRIIVSAHSGGYRPAAYALHVGGMGENVTDVFLFDAFYANQEYCRDWLLNGNGRLWGAYTPYLADQHTAFAKELQSSAGDRLRFTSTDVSHEEVVRRFFPEWLSGLSGVWLSTSGKQPIDN
ncbi:MAG: serine hydrolase [Bacteroidota bacterium]